MMIKAEDLGENSESHARTSSVEDFQIGGEQMTEEARVKTMVRKGYGKAIRKTSCCGTSENAKKIGYDNEELESVPEGAAMAVSAAAGEDGANNLSPSACAPARVIAAQSSALAIRASRPAVRFPSPNCRT